MLFAAVIIVVCYIAILYLVHSHLHEVILFHDVLTFAFLAFSLSLSLSLSLSSLSLSLLSSLVSLSTLKLQRPLAFAELTLKKPRMSVMPECAGREMRETRAASTLRWTKP
jgi:hypothetical protein